MNSHTKELKLVAKAIGVILTALVMLLFMIMVNEKLIQDNVNIVGWVLAGILGILIVIIYKQQFNNKEQ